VIKDELQRLATTWRIKKNSSTAAAVMTLPPCIYERNMLFICLCAVCVRPRSCCEWVKMRWKGFDYTGLWYVKSEAKCLLLLSLFDFPPAFFYHFSLRCPCSLHKFCWSCESCHRFPKWLGFANTCDLLVVATSLI